jgi:hypothetical protein
MAIVKAQAHDRRAYDQAKRVEAEDRLYRNVPQRANSDADKAQEAAEAAVERARQRIEAVYKEHAPEKVAKIDALLRKYAGKESKLADAVEKKYCEQKAAGDVGSDEGCEDRTGQGAPNVSECDQAEPEVKTPEPPSADENTHGGGGSSTSPRPSMRRPRATSVEGRAASPTDASNQEGEGNSGNAMDQPAVNRFDEDGSDSETEVCMASAVSLVSCSSCA